MKIYSIAIKNENNQYFGTPILTADEFNAIELKKEWEKELPKKLEVIIFKYEVKTQGKNYGNYACAQKFKNKL